MMAVVDQKGDRVQVNRDERAARLNNLYIGVGYKSKLCHEDWITGGEKDAQ